MPQAGYSIYTGMTKPLALDTRVCNDSDVATRYTHVTDRPAASSLPISTFWSSRLGSRRRPVRVLVVNAALSCALVTPLELTTNLT
jgi:hypothetical protein